MELYIILVQTICEALCTCTLFVKTIVCVISIKLLNYKTAMKVIIVQYNQ